MANNFKDIPNKFPTHYIAKTPAGNDSNPGTSKQDPLATPKQVITLQQLGAGTYNGLNNSFSFDYIGDGLVVLDNCILANAGYARLTNIYLINSTFFSTNGNLTERKTLVNCTLKNIVNFANYVSSRSSIFTNNIFIECNFNSLHGSDNDFTLYINSNVFDLTGTVKNSYSNINSDIYITNVSAAPAKDAFRNNNIQGTITIDQSNFTDNLNKKYAIQDEFIGTPQDNGYANEVNWLTEAQLTTDGYTGTISGWDAAVATCINRDPLFNNASLEDFTLQANSPHIGRATDGSNIGGTDVAVSTLVEDDGIGTIKITSSAEIDTSITNSWKLLTGETQGTITILQRVAGNSVTLGEIDPISAFNFDTDFAGGTVQNNNVIDSQPLSVNYPRKLTTTSLASNTTTVNVTAHDVLVGEFVRIAGEDREVTAIATNSFTVVSAFRAAVANNVTFQVGTETQVASLRPNRLTYLLRTSNKLNEPTLDSEWDNDVAPIYGIAGDYLVQEWYESPSYVINLSDEVFGGGDSRVDPALAKNTINARWIEIIVYIRNDYTS